MGVIGSILDLGRRSLNAQAQTIRTTGDNIANVNTPGYSRRTAELVTTQSAGVGNLQVGTGVAVRSILRNVDQFINKQLRDRITDRAGGDIRQQYLERAEQPFSLENTAGHISFELSKFFNSLQDLSSNPSDLGLRQQVIQSGEDLVSSIKGAYNSISGLQREADNRLSDLVSRTNTLTSQIADLNQQISVGETGTQENLTLRDRRDQALRDLAEIIPVQTVEDSQGQAIVSMPNGFALVNGATATQLTFTRSPDFATFPVGLDGSALGRIVYDYNSATNNSQIDFTNSLYSSGGEIGGLLRFRGVSTSAQTSAFQATGDTVEFASRIEAMSRDLLTRFNLSYRGADESPTGSAGVLNPSAGGLDNSTPGVFGLFSFAGASDLDSNGQPTISDLTGSGIANFSSILSFNVSDPRSLAAALDLDPNEGALSFAQGDARNISNLSALRTQQVNYGSYSVGNFSTTATIEELYRQTVGYVGAVSERATSDAKAYQAREEQVKEMQSSVSAVNLDEEFANLVNFQRGYQASARLITISDQMLQEIINLI